MSKKISYGTKAPFQDKPEIPVENKVTANDMNEIKEAVNGNADELDTAKEDIENLQGGQGTASADITNLKNRVTTLEGDNKTNKTNISNLQNNKVDKVNGKGLSTEDFTTQLKTKLEGLNNYDDTEIKQDISDIKEEQQTQNNNIKNLQKNDAQQDKSIEALQKENTELKEECSRLRQDLKAFPSGQAEGEYITLKDSADSRFNKFVLKGNSKQDSRSGKNKLNLKNIIQKSYCNIEVQEDKLIVTPTDDNYAGFFIVECNLKAGNYYVHLNSPVTTFNLAFRDSENNNLVGNLYTSATITTEQDVVQIRINTTANQRNYTLNFEDLYINEGTSDLGYEPYGAMPSPEYPSEIQNVEGNANITICNNNLCYKSIIRSNDNIDFYFKPKSIAKTVTLSFITDKSLSNNSIYCKVDGVDLERLATVSSNANSKSLVQITFTDEKYEKIKNANECYFELYKGGANFETIKEAMIENSSVVTDYLAHQEQEFTFPLATGQKLYKGDYLASDGIHHVRKQIELDGTENWVKYNDYNNSFRCSLPISAYNGICSHYKTITSLSQINKDNSMYCAKSKYLYISDLRFTNVEDFKEYLLEQKQKGTPVVIEYLINNNKEEIEPYTSEQQKAYEQRVQTAKSYKNVTNIYSPDPVSPVFEVNYRKDIETMLEQVQAQTNAINELLSTTKTSATLLDNLQSDLESEVM